MLARDRGSELAVGAALAAALLMGLLAGSAPLVAVAAVAGIGFVALVFTDLAAGLAVLGFLSFLEVLPTSGSLSLPKAAGLLLAVAWVARILTRERERDFFAEFPALTWALVAFIAWAMLTLVWAKDPSPGITAIIRYLPNVLLLPIAYTAVRTRRDLTLVLGALVLGAVVAASFGIVKPPGPEVIEARATGTIGDPNELAAALLVGLALGAGFTLSRQGNLAVRAGGAIAVPICALGIFLSLSRGGLIALAAALLAGTVLAGRWRAAMAVLLVITASAGVLYFTDVASPRARERVTQANGGSGRSDVWTIGLRMVSAHPIGGVGVGNFQVASSDYVIQPGLIVRADAFFSTAPKITHNTYLQFLTEMGIVGLLLFVGIVLACLRCALSAAQLWSAQGEVGMEALARGTLLALVGLLVADFFISENYGKLLWMLLAICPAMLALAKREAASAARRVPA